MGRVASLRAVEPHLEVALLGLLPLGAEGYRWPLTTDDAPWDFFEIPAHSESALRAPSSWGAGLKVKRSHASMERSTFCPLGIIWQNQIN